MVVRAEQIDSIVAAVVQKLREQGLAVRHGPTSAPSPKTAAPTPAVLREKASPPETDLAAKLITLETLRDLTPSIGSLRIKKTAVVTPAAKDELRARGITLVRYNDAGQPPNKVVFLVEQTTQQRDIESLQISGVSVQVCETEEKTAGAAREALRGNGTQVICISRRPFALAQNLSGSANLTAVIVRDTTEARDAIEQVSPDAFVIDRDNWESISLAQLVRSLEGNIK